MTNKIINITLMFIVSFIFLVSWIFKLFSGDFTIEIAIVVGEKP